MTTHEAAKALVDRIDYLADKAVPLSVLIIDEVAQLREALAEPAITLTPEAAEALLGLALLTSTSDRTPEEQAAVDYTADALDAVQGVRT